LSVSDDPADVMRLVRAGARGYITKRVDGPSLVEAITRVARGEAVFSPRLAGFVLDAFSQPHETAIGHRPAEDESSEIDIDRLSAREREVMRHLARGYTYKEIGVELHISPRTVESHASAVLRKLQLSNRHELTHWAARNRYI
jgi:DNA-binding NarL/FixJ family response regulator